MRTMRVVPLAPRVLVIETFGSNFKQKSLSVSLFSGSFRRWCFSNFGASLRIGETPTGMIPMCSRGLPLMVLMTVCWTYQSLLVVQLKTVNWVVVLWSFFISSFISSAPLVIYFRRSPFGGSALKPAMKCLLLLSPVFEVTVYIFMTLVVKLGPVGK